MTATAYADYARLHGLLSLLGKVHGKQLPANAGN